MSTLTKTIKVFEVTEDEWIAAETAEEAAALYRKMVNEATYKEVLEEWGAPVELTTEQLEKLRWCDHDANPPHCVTFAERLREVIAEGSPFPQYFAACI